MEALIAAIATIIVALIGLVGVFVESTRRTNKQDHEATMFLIKSAIRDIGGLRADIRHLTARFNAHVDKD